VGFQHLQSLNFIDINFTGAAVIDLLSTLAETNVGQRLMHLTFWG